MLREISRTHKDKYHIITHKYNLKIIIIVKCDMIVKRRLFWGEPGEERGRKETVIVDEHDQSAYI
jgi:hypothetical protein